MKTIKQFSLYVVIATLFYILSETIKSDFIYKFLEDNIITILIALLAINITTMSVVMTKLQELYDKFGPKFGNTITSLKHAMIEQVTLIVFSVLILIIKDSTIISNAFKFCEPICNVSLIAIFIAGVAILFDTGNAVFIIVDFEKQK